MLDAPRQTGIMVRVVYNLHGQSHPGWTMETCAQYFMPPDHVAQCDMQRLRMQRAFDDDGTLRAVGLVATLLLEEPHMFLLRRDAKAFADFRLRV
jgi:hypothetical protein